MSTSHWLRGPRIVATSKTGSASGTSLEAREPLETHDRAARRADTNDANDANDGAKDQSEDLDGYDVPIDIGIDPEEKTVRFDASYLLEARAMMADAGGDRPPAPRPAAGSHVRTSLSGDVHDALAANATESAAKNAAASTENRDVAQQENPDAQAHAESESRRGGGAGRDTWTIDQEGPADYAASKHFRADSGDSVQGVAVSPSRGDMANFLPPPSKSKLESSGRADRESHPRLSQPSQLAGSGAEKPAAENAASGSDGSSSSITAPFSPNTGSPHTGGRSSVPSAPISSSGERATAQVPGSGRISHPPSSGNLPSGNALGRNLGGTNPSSRPTPAAQPSAFPSSPPSASPSSGNVPASSGNVPASGPVSHRASSSRMPGAPQSRPSSPPPRPSQPSHAGSLAQTLPQPSSGNPFGPVSREGSAGGRADGDTDGLPKKFGKYTLLRKLATGGMAELFLAIQRSVAGFEKLIVIKRILPAMNQDRAFIDMLLHEARVAATLSHPSIVQIFDVGQVDGIFFIAMEHVHGEDLRSIVRQMKKKGVADFPLEHAISIILGMCSGLAYAHEKRDLDGSALNIVHRDISPQNVVVTFAGDVKIVDFGIAQSDTKLNTETKSGKLKGKVPYMSPEQARGEAIDSRSDIFAVGVMLFELTTGKRLFKGASEFETLKLICDREYPLPSQVREGYPIELEYIVMRALAKDRNDRFQSAREMQAALEEFVRRERIPVSTIALNQFMQSLFEEKLASQKEALLQGKQLADIIELQTNQPGTSDYPRGLDSGHEFEGQNRLSASILSSPAASRTVTDVNAASLKSGRRAGPIVAAILGLAIVGGGAALFMRARANDSAAAKSAGAAATAMKGAIRVTSDPPGAAIWINGDLRSEVTPATVAQLPTGGAIDVKLTKDGYEQARQNVQLTDAAPNSTVNVALKRGSVSVDVATKNDAAKLALSLDGKPFPGLVIDGVSSGDAHKLVVSAPGYADQTLSFSGAPFEKKHFDVTLERTGDVSARHAARAAAATAAAQAAPVSPAGNGKLNVGASGGWCNVTVDGVARGATPVAGVELSAGVHKVTCAPPDGKAPQTATVNVSAEGTTRYRFTLGG